MKPSTRHILSRTVAVIVALGVWEAAYRAGFINKMVFSSPSLVLKAAYEDGWVFLLAFRITLFEIAVAILASWTLGIGFGALAGASRPLARISAPILGGFIAIPFVILYPVLMAWFGIGPESKIVFGTLLGVFPIALNTLAGVASIPSGHVTMARAFGASRMQILAQVVVPLALPSVIAGLRLGTSLAVVGVILTEMLASTDGIGFLISYHRSLYNTGDVVLGIVMGLAAAFVANTALGALERRFGGWRLRQQDHAQE